NRWHLLISLFILFILAKAFWGYYKFGPLAFRTSALFYYPLFAVISYYFFNQKLLSQKLIYFLLIIFLLTIKIIGINNYYSFTYLILSIILILKIKNKWAKFIFFVLLFVSFPFKNFFVGSRSHIVGLISSFSFLVFLLTLLKIKRRYINFGIAIILISLTLLLAPKLYKSALSFIANKSKLIQLYKDYDSIILAKQNDFYFQEIPVKLYNRNIPLKETPTSLPKETPTSLPKETPTSLPKETPTSLPKETPTSLLEPIYNENNILWRLFIWRDMLEDIVKEKAWLGVNFGKPQRSKSIEILGWTEGEWQRDGWITPHNSFLHIIYRAGIVGLIWIIVIFSLIIFMVKRFLFKKNSVGILLVSIFIYWIAVANSLVILEFPHNAIPFWTLFGLTLAYASKK
ncbi:MAG: O-antigen ligase family protein, partial [Candidatus Omnitrophica bacterium]|nr:O-antigen ligase family protein [Candidatus Omnitrophota bacterium]